jgi:hypothetical protein
MVLPVRQHVFDEPAMPLVGQLERAGQFFPLDRPANRGDMAPQQFRQAF